MSVLPMKRVIIVGMKSDRKQILEFLQRRGVLEVRTPKPGKALIQEDDPVFQQIDMSSAKITFDKNVNVAKQALDVLNQAVPDPNAPSMFSGRKAISLTDYETKVKKRDTIMELVYQINSLAKRDAEIKAEIPRVESQLETLQPWLTYELPLEFEGTKYTRVFIGTFPNEVPMEDIYSGIESNAKDITGVDVSIISSSPEQTCVQIVALKKDAAKVEEALRHMSFARPPISGKAPGEQAKDLSNRLDALNKKSAEINENIKLLTDKREDVKFIIDYFKMRSDKYEVLSDLYQSPKTFIITGFAPERETASLAELLESRFDCIVEIKEPKPTTKTPVALTNNGFAAPVEGVVESYSIPGKGEFDPSLPVACFYYILFGLMLSDAAYGIIIVIACAIILSKCKNMEPGTRNTMKMFLFCGIGTTFWGFMFGSFFGDVVNVFASTFLGRSDIALPPIWFEPIDAPIKMLAFSFLIGLIHLFTGLGIKFYTLVKHGQILDAIYDVVFWYFLVGGSVFFLLTMPMITEMLGLSWILPAPVANVALVFMVIGAVGIILTGGRESKNWFKRILKGLYSFYGITSYLSDVLSYSRLLALGLATSVISTVFNKMGSMVASGVGGGIIGFLLFLIIFVIGHALNLAINALGAYVHTNRLQYVEFFGKFFDGGGKAFEPFKENTTYYKVSE
ncbi:MAG: V-type ATP synthase subunit I [Butyrivibrio sp.]|nr:V-type ATP synthase subunit I [Butyrivibrio sp.]